MTERLYRRSFALWEETRSTTNKKLSEKLLAYYNAITYELQPIRFSSFNRHKWSETYYVWNQHFKTFLLKTLPYALKNVVKFLFNLSYRQWLLIIGIILYYIAVRIIHKLLDAGPIVLILTALITIFTIGLGDDDNENRVSAYSVFNRGFQSLLGSVDAEQLLQQYVGGGTLNTAAAFAGGGGGGGGGGVENLNNNQGGRNVEQQQQQPVAALDEEEEQINGDLMAATGELRQQHPVHRARKSGKKTRRRNLEQRREIQRQRQAAHDFEDNDIALQQVLQQEIIDQRVDY